MSQYLAIVGIDYSDSSKIALLTAARIVSAVPGGELHVVHVITPYRPYSHDGGALTGLLYPNTGAEFSSWLAKAREDVREGLPKFCAKVLNAALEGTVGHVRIGRADRELVVLAGELKADLLVVGTHGHTGLERVFLGSVAERVVRAAPCAVLVARSPDAADSALIEAPCPDCVQTRKASNGAQLWCTRHAEHHSRPHTYTEYPESFGVGSLTFRL